MLVKENKVKLNLPRVKNQRDFSNTYTKYSTGSTPGATSTLPAPLHGCSKTEQPPPPYIHKEYTVKF